MLYTLWDNIIPCRTARSQFWGLMNSAAKVKLIDFDAAMELKSPDQVMLRLPGDLTAVSPERSSGARCQALQEDVFMVGHTFLRLMDKAEDDGHEAGRGALRARIRPLLRAAHERPPMAQIVEDFKYPITEEPEPAEPLPTLLSSTPARQTPLEKLFQ